jgi:hypothetical protein
VETLGTGVLQWQNEEDGSSGLLSGQEHSPRKPARQAWVCKPTLGGCFEKDHALAQEPSGRPLSQFGSRKWLVAGSGGADAVQESDTRKVRRQISVTIRPVLHQEASSSILRDQWLEKKAA